MKSLSGNLAKYFITAFLFSLPFGFGVSSAFAFGLPSASEGQPNYSSNHAESEKDEENANSTAQTKPTDESHSMRASHQEIPGKEMKRDAHNDTNESDFPDNE